MEFLVTMTTHVPAGTPDDAVDDIRRRESARAAELAAEGRLLRLWRPPLQPGEWRTLGLFQAGDEAELEKALASMPLRVWRTDEVTPLNPHPNDPATGMRRHQLDQDTFRSVLPEAVDWQPFPAFPASVRLAVLVGRPAEPGPYVIRVKVPGGVKLMPHIHPEDRVYTVISGVFLLGRGGRFDETELEAYPPGAVVVLPGGTPHFHWAKFGEYVTQVSAIGPLDIEYLDREDDPRRP